MALILRGTKVFVEEKNKFRKSFKIFYCGGGGGQHLFWSALAPAPAETSAQAKEAFTFNKFFSSFSH